MHSRAVCFHKPYSTSAEWLPPVPTTRVSEDQIFSSSTNFSVSEYDLFGGVEVVINQVVNEGRVISDSNMIVNRSYDDIAERGMVFRQMRNTLQQVNVSTVCESVGQMEIEAEQGYQSRFDPALIELKSRDDGSQLPVTALPTSDAVTSDDNINASDIAPSDPSDNTLSRYQVLHEQRQAVQKMMCSQATLREGYVFWLDYTNVDHTWELTAPQPINYFSEVTKH